MPDIFSLSLPLLHFLPPETAHEISIRALRCDLLPAKKIAANPMLAQNIFGLEFKNPVGMAAGFDKNAEVINPLFKQGFGFVEAGTVTPLPQPGNPRPRLFRLKEDKAVINRLGFNNKGLDYFVKNFAARNQGRGIAGANIGKNKDTQDAEQDYALGLKAVYPHANYITINISSPNTPLLRNLQEREPLSQLLSELMKAKNECALIYKKNVPLLLKIAPDIDAGQREDIAGTVLDKGIDGLIVSNTTISRPPSLKSKYKNETGGLSGSPLFNLSTSTLAEMYKLIKGKIPLIGVGGIASPEDAYLKICAGASLVQLYSALVYQGFGLVQAINHKLPLLLARDGFSHISEAVGSKNQ
jgi:dihydroorotate dehydrogenase